MKKILLILSITFLSTQLFAEDSFDNYFSVGYLNSSAGKEINRKGATSGSLDGGNMKGGNGFMVAIGKHLDESPMSIELEYMSLKEDFIEFTTKDSSVTEKGSGFVETVVTNLAAGFNSNLLITQTKGCYCVNNA